MSRQQPQAHRFARLAGTAPFRQAVRIRASPSTKLPILLLLLLALLLFSFTRATPLTPPAHHQPAHNQPAHHPPHPPFLWQAPHSPAHSDSTIGSYDNSRRGSFSSSESGSRGSTPSNSPRHGHAAAAARRRR